MSMPEDQQTLALWGQALSMTGDVTSQAVKAAGFGSPLNLDHQQAVVKATIAASQIQACATLFAALVEAEMLRQLKEARDVR